MMKFIPIIGVRFFKGTLSDGFFFFYLWYQALTSFAVLVILVELLEYYFK